MDAEKVMLKKEHEPDETSAAVIQDSRGEQQQYNIGNWVAMPNDISGFVGTTLALLIGVVTWWFKHKYRDSVMNKAEGNLYQQLATEQNRLIERIKILEESKDLCVDELSILKGSIHHMNELKEENLMIKQKLSERDYQIETRESQISELLSKIETKDKQILDLTLRVHALELRLSTIKSE